MEAICLGAFEPRLTKVPHIAIKRPPFRINETGWGEFDMNISLIPLDKGPEISIAHDLNFQSERYESKHLVVSLPGQPKSIL